jgi:hypothetical protein
MHNLTQRICKICEGQIRAYDSSPDQMTFLCAGSEDDDRGGVDIRRVLASIPHVLHTDVIRATDHQH